MTGCTLHHDDRWWCYYPHKENRSNNNSKLIRINQRFTLRCTWKSIMHFSCTSMHFCSFDFIPFAVENVMSFENQTAADIVLNMKTQNVLIQHRECLNGPWQSNLITSLELDEWMDGNESRFTIKILLSEGFLSCILCDGHDRPFIRYSKSFYCATIAHCIVS